MALKPRTRSQLWGWGLLVLLVAEQGSGRSWQPVPGTRQPSSRPLWWHKLLSLCTTQMLFRGSQCPCAGTAACAG